MVKDEKWIQVKNANVKYYEEVELYYRNPAGNTVLYKPEGLKFEDASFDRKYIDDFFIKPEDKLKCIKAAHKGFSKNLSKNITNQKTETVKTELVKLIGETLSQPRNSGLSMTTSIIDSIVKGYSSNSNAITNLAMLSFADYTTTIHSVNVMALTLGYCLYNHVPEEETRQMGIAALLHDLGKTDIREDIVNSNRKLTDPEFTRMKKHTVIGLDILKHAGIDSKIVKEGVQEHHERLDGSGYPEGKTDISECGRILGIIDSYEVITNDHRPYRQSLTPLKALELLKKETDNGKYDKEIFGKFAYSLTKSR